MRAWRIVSALAFPVCQTLGYSAVFGHLLFKTLSERGISEEQFFKKTLGRASNKLLIGRLISFLLDPGSSFDGEGALGDEGHGLCNQDWYFYVGVMSTRLMYHRQRIGIGFRA